MTDFNDRHPVSSVMLRDANPDAAGDQVFDEFQRIDEEIHISRHGLNVEFVVNARALLAALELLLRE